MFSIRSHILSLSGNNGEVASEFATQTFKVKNGLESQLEQTENPSRNFFQVLIDATEDKPWLWAVYVLCVLIPCIALGAYFFGRKTSSSDLDPKKTDAIQPDDEEELLDEANAEELDDQPGPSSGRVTKLHIRAHLNFCYTLSVHTFQEVEVDSKAGGDK